MRPEGRQNDELRKMTFEPNFIPHAEGSVLVSFGRTRVLCVASVEEKQPQHLTGTQKGWVTARGRARRRGPRRIPRRA